MNRLPTTALEVIEQDIEGIDSFNSTSGYGTTRILFSEEEI